MSGQHCDWLVYMQLHQSITFKDFCAQMLFSGDCIFPCFSQAI